MDRRDIHAPVQNRLLALLQNDARERMERAAERLSLGLKDVLYERDAPIRFVYFPVSGVLSAVITMREGGTVEVATVGNEGMVGTPLFLGSDRSPTIVFSQVPGDVLRITAQDFRKELEEPDQSLPRIVARYSQAYVNQVSQSVACNHLHPVESALAAGSS